MTNKRRKLILGAAPTLCKHKIYEEINIDGTKVASKPSASRKQTLELERVEVSKVYYSLWL